MLDRRTLFRTAWRYAHWPTNSSGRKVWAGFPAALWRPRAVLKNPSSVECWITVEAGRIIAEIRARKTAGTFRPIHHPPWRFGMRACEMPNHGYVTETLRIWRHLSQRSPTDRCSIIRVRPNSK